jgi:NOL1/NOP2/fmu family ribosome biogenesis protein
MTGDDDGTAEQETDGDAPAENVSDRFDRLPATADERRVEGRPTREEILEWWDERFGVDASVFETHSFWERGNGKIWAFRGEVASPAELQALGIRLVRTRQEFWKPTLEAVQRFGHHVSKNRLELTREQAEQFVAGEDQEIDWDGDWGYLVVTHELAGEQEPLGVGLFTYGELASMVPKGRRREL